MAIKGYNNAHSDASLPDARYSNQGEGNGESGASTQAGAPFSASTWPEPLAAEAFYGLAGEVVRTIEPHSEADPAALLIQLLVAFGNVVGRDPHFTVDGVKHSMNLFAVLVGRSAKSRKGTSWARIFNLFREVDETWTGDRVQSGLSSGEGLIYAVRDPGLIQKGGKRDYDPGVADKRLQVVEPEFGAVLKVCARDANTLSTTIRQSWDSGNLRTLTKNNPLVATDAHVSIIGHTTRDDLTRNLTDNDQANGFANRFLWVCVTRSKLLPDGGALRDEDVMGLWYALGAAVQFAKSVDEMQWAEEARALWHEVYPSLSCDRFRLFGAVTGRAEAQTLRLACCYALLDRSDVIRVEHLRAALAVWQYCEHSARFIFGDSLGDPAADTILRALRADSAGLTRTEVSKLFARNLSAGELGRALDVLREYGLATCQREESAAGRPVERWFALNGSEVVQGGSS